MSQSKVGTSHVKPGRLTNGDLNLEKAREARGPLEHGLDALSGAAPPPQPPPPSPELPFLAWDEEMDADAQLQLYLDRAKEPKQRGFPPFEALSARLNELPAPNFQHHTTERDAATRQPQPSLRRRRASDLEWFEERFLELKAMLSRRELRHERDRFNQYQACRDYRPRRPPFHGIAWRENHGSRGNSARGTFTLA